MVAVVAVDQSRLWYAAYDASPFEIHLLGMSPAGHMATWFPSGAIEIY